MARPNRSVHHATNWRCCSISRSIASSMLGHRLAGRPSPHAERHDYTGARGGPHRAPAPGGARRDGGRPSWPHTPRNPHPSWNLQPSIERPSSRPPCERLTPRGQIKFLAGIINWRYPTAPMLSGARVLPSPVPGHSAVPATTPSAGGRFGSSRPVNWRWKQGALRSSGLLLISNPEAPTGNLLRMRAGFLLRRINSRHSPARMLPVLADRPTTPISLGLLS